MHVQNWLASRREQGALDYVDDAFDVWRERSCHAWKLELDDLYLHIIPGQNLDYLSTSRTAL